MKIFMSTTTFLIGILFLLPGCSPSFGAAKEPVRNKRAMPEVQHYVDKNGNGAIKYPPSARNKSIQGIVILTVIINKFGKVQEVINSKSLSNDCDAAAKIAFLQSTKQGYVPLIIDGNTVDFKVDIPVGFG